MNESKQKGSKRKVLKKLFLYAAIPLCICFLIYGWFFTYNLPSKVTALIKEELDKYDFGTYSIEAVSVRHNKAVIGPISFGEGEDKLKIAKVQLDYTFEGIRNGEIESVTVSGADLHLNSQGKWQLAGLQGILRGIANYQKANPSEKESPLPEINVETSILTLHYLGRQYTFPLNIEITGKNKKILLDVQTNLSRDKLQTFTFVLDPETLALDLKLDSFSLDIAQAGHFLQKFGMKDSKGSISAKAISLNLSKDRVDLGAKIHIENFKTVYMDEGKPVTLTFDKLEPFTISRNLKDNKDVFENNINFHKLAYSYGTYLFNAEEIKSKVYFDIGSNTYKTDSLLKNAIAQIDGSKINSQSEVHLKLNWLKGELTNYSAKGKLDFSYSGGFLEGLTNINVSGTEKALTVNGDFTGLKIPEGNIQKGTFSFKEENALLKLDVKAQNFSVLSGNLKGNSSFIYNRENGLVDISGSLKELSIFDRFTGNGEVTILETEEALTTSLKGFSFTSKKEGFGLALEAELKQETSFEEFINKPFRSSFKASSSISRLKISEYIFKPFGIKLMSDTKSLSFSVSDFESDDIKYLKFKGLSGSYDLNKSQADIKFKTHISLGDKLPGFKGRFEPVDMNLNFHEKDGFLKLAFSESIPESSFSYLSSDNSFKCAVKHQSRMAASIPLKDILKSKLTSFKSTTQVKFKDFISGPLEMDETSTVLKLSSEKAVGFDNYLDLSLKGSLSNSLNSIQYGLKKSTKKEMASLGIAKWKEGLVLKNLSTDLPFNWSIRKGFSDTEKCIQVDSLSHFRWVDGGDFLGYFPKKVTIDDLNLKGGVEGLSMEVDEKIKLNDKLSVSLKLNSGWEIPENILSGSKSPLSFLTQIALVPQHGFVSTGSISLADSEITDLALFIKEPISEDNIVKGKVSAEVNFLKNSQGLKVPAVVEIKNTRAYIVGENDYYLKIKGLRGKLKFESLLDLKSEDSQYLRIDFLEAPGLKLDKTLVKYKVYSPEKVRIMRLNTTWCGGEIEGADLLFNPAHKSLNCTIYASKVEMEEVMELMKGVECKANGSLYGRMTLEVRNGKVMNQDGFLFSEPGTKMSLQMQGDNVIYDSITDERTRKLLSNLDVQYFKILFKGGSDIDKHKTIFNLKGTSAVGDPPNPLDLSINFNGPVIYYLQLPLHDKGIKEFIENKAKGKK